jgi:hypothetical protein
MSVQGQPNSPDGRVERLETSVERLTSEVTSLKLELATLVSALRERSFQLTPVQAAAPPKKREPPSRPSITPAAIVVLLATGLLSWQLVTTPVSLTSVPRVDAPSPYPSALPMIEVPATEPPLTPLVKPTIYRGTLAINADHPGATVFVNRRNVGTAPVRVRNLKAGAHLVWVESDGYRRWTRVVTVPFERVTRVLVDLEPLEPMVEP